MVEEMAASNWRIRRTWCIETQILAEGMSGLPKGDDVARITQSFRRAASTGELALLHRYETRIHNMFQRCIHNILLLRAAGLPNEPNPIFEQSPSIEVTPVEIGPPDPE